MTTAHALTVAEETPLATRLYLARKAVGLTVAEVAQRIGVSTSTWEKTEAGARSPRAGELIAFAQMTGQDVSFFGASPDRQAEAPNLPLLPGAVNPDKEA